MKNVSKIAMFLVAATSLFSCAGGSYTISGKIDGAKSTEAYLAVGETIDTAVVVDGVFEFTGSVEEPTMATLQIEGQGISLMLENVAISVEGAAQFIGETAVTGAPSQVVFDEFIVGASKLAQTQDAQVAYRKEFISAHSDAYFTPYLIGSIAGLLQPDEIQAMMDKLSPEVQATEVSQKIYTQLQEAIAQQEKAKAIAAGNAPDFTMNDVDGNPVKLSDVYGKSKYLLIDFWASWCGPCRKENPNVVDSYKRFHDKGFDILGVSLDNKQEAWVEAIAKDELTWTHVSDLKGWKNEAAAMYAVRSIPANFLVDNTGKIIATNLREAALAEKLSELLD